MIRILKKKLRFQLLFCLTKCDILFCFAFVRSQNSQLKKNGKCHSEHDWNTSKALFR